MCCFEGALGFRGLGFELCVLGSSPWGLGFGLQGLGLGGGSLGFERFAWGPGPAPRSFPAVTGGGALRRPRNPDLLQAAAHCTRHEPQPQNSEAQPSNMEAQPSNREAQTHLSTKVSRGSPRTSRWLVRPASLGGLFLRPPRNHASYGDLGDYGGANLFQGRFRRLGV